MLKRIKPIRIYWQDGVMGETVEFSKGVVSSLLRLAGVRDKIQIELCGFMSIKAHKDTSKNSPYYGKYNSSKIMEDLIIDQYVDMGKYYSLILVKDTLFYRKKDEHCNLVGLAVENRAVVVNVGESFETDDMPLIFLKIYHEFGHLFGMLGAKKDKNGIYLAGRMHCDNVCIMHKRSSGHLYCQTCLKELCDYFKK